MIINADDLGRSPETNDAILLAFQQNLISDTSVMTTCRDGLEDLARKVSNNQFSFLGGVGCHLCLTLGEPLNVETKITRFVENGLFIDSSAAPRRWCLYKKERVIVYKEFLSQVRFIREKLKLDITHLDSHQHIHFGVDLLPVVVKLCRKERIPYLRIPHFNRRLPFKSLIAVKLKIMYIRAHGIRTISLFGSPQQVLSSITKKKTICEVMVHPVFNSKGIIVNKVRINDADHCEMLETQIKAFGRYEKTNYNKLTKSTFL